LTIGNWKSEIPRVAIEIEKKYRLTKKQREAVLSRLPKIGAKLKRKEFEENTLYGGNGVDLDRNVLRLRRVGKRAILTYKERHPTSSAIKHQQEEETEIKNAKAMDAILQALGFAPTLVYEKKRLTWRLAAAEIVLDDLPFGLFMEIEGSESEIRDLERRLAIKGLRTEHSTYPGLSLKHGKKKGGVVESRFEAGEK
jgi:adenylate cyclase, class 2